MPCSGLPCDTSDAMALGGKMSRLGTILLAILVVGSTVVSSRPTLVEGQEPEFSETLAGTDSGYASPFHVTYDPFARRGTLPDYPYNGVTSLRPPSSLPSAKPSGIDLDVTYISRTPLCNRYDVWYTYDGRPYLRPGSEHDKRWPAQGKVVTFTAHMANKGTVPSGSFAYKWFIDDIEVSSGTHSTLNPGEEGVETFEWTWAHSLDGERLLGSHTVRFVADPANAILETYESNNSLEDRTDALSLVLAVTPELYAALETPADPQWPYSAEDWLQKQIAAMNAAFTRSVYASAPDGIVERVRLDSIVIASSPPPTNWSEDGGFFMSADDRFGNAYYDPETDVSGGLLHELTHQLGIIDMYNLNVPLEVPQVLDRLGRPVQMEYFTGALFPGLMNNPGIRPPIYDEHTSVALNANKGYRRGYYGEYLYDVPEQTYVRVLDNRGSPAAGITVRLYQRSSDPGSYGCRFGIIDNVPEIAGVTDSNGLLLLTNRTVGTSTTTNTGHTLRDNPFGVIDIVGKNDEFILELAKGSHQEYHWLDITQFNLTVWRSDPDSTIEMDSHVPGDDAPAPSSQLSGVVGSGLVYLQWAVAPDAVGYDIYRASGPLFDYQRIVTDSASLSYADPYDYGKTVCAYAVTALDADGRESGFTNLFYAFRVVNPASVVMDGVNRIVLDPQNGYALLYQLADGTFVDTRSSYDYHLEYSFYMVRDRQGRLIVSHPGDYYTSRQSVRVFDQNYTLAWEFADTGSGPGQLQAPAGLAVWGQPCGGNSCRFLVADSGNHRIQVFDENGIFLSTYGQAGSGNGQFNDPQGLTLDSSGDAIIADSGNNRLQVLHFDGTNLSFLRSITVGLSYPAGVVTYGADYIVVADTGNSRVKVLDDEGNLVAEYEGPNDGNVGAFDQPRNIVVDGAGNIVVADTGNRRVVTILGALPAWQVYLPLVTRSP